MIYEGYKVLMCLGIHLTKYIEAHHKREMIQLVKKKFKNIPKYEKMHCFREWDSQ